ERPDGRARSGGAFGARWSTSGSTGVRSRRNSIAPRDAAAAPSIGDALVSRSMGRGISYRDAGVNIRVAEDALARIKRHVERTRRPEVISEIGGFGGLFR